MTSTGEGKIEATDEEMITEENPRTRIEVMNRLVNDLDVQECRRVLAPTEVCRSQKRYCCVIVRCAATNHPSGLSLPFPTRGQRSSIFHTRASKPTTNQNPNSQPPDHLPHGTLGGLSISCFQENLGGNHCQPPNEQTQGQRRRGIMTERP